MGIFSKVSSLLGSSGSTQAESVESKKAVRLQLHDSWLQAVKDSLLQSALDGPTEQARKDLSELSLRLNAMKRAPLGTDWNKWSPPLRLDTHAAEQAEKREREAELQKSIIVVGDENDPESCSRYRLPPAREISPENVWTAVQEAAVGLREAGYPQAISQVFDAVYFVFRKVSNPSLGTPAPKSRLS